MGDRSMLVRSSRSEGWALLAILGLSAWFNLTNLGFPVTVHGDEPIKVEFIQNGTQNFKHPLLMLQLVRGANMLFDLTNPLNVAVLGRALLGVCATVTVLLSYLLARRSLSARGALAVAAAVAVAPTLVVHAHYLKEDTILTTCLMASALCFLKFTERLSVRSAIWLGLATGLAFSAHYKAVLLVPLYLVAPLAGLPARRVDERRDATLHAADSAGRTRTFYARLTLAGAIAGCVFLAVNWPLLLDPRTFLTGMLFEADHAQIGHDVPIWGLDYWLGFHLLHSLVPGLGALATMLAVGGLGWVVMTWRTAPVYDRWLVSYISVFYFVPEISPLKPWPDFSRYMLPIVPPLLYFAWKGTEAVARQFRNSGPRAWIFTAGLASLVLLPAYMSVRLVSGLGDDTRVQAAEWLERHPGWATFEAYSGEGRSVRSLVELDPAAWRARGVDYLVASSFMYDRYATGARLRNRRPEIYWTHERYLELFRLPYVEFSPAYRTFAFSNPVIRIIDLRELSARER
jgi:hypothetical protein